MKNSISLSMIFCSIFLLAACEKEKDAPEPDCSATPAIQALMQQSDYDLLNHPAAPATIYTQASYSNIQIGLCSMEIAGSYYTLLTGKSQNGQGRTQTSASGAASSIRHALRSCQCGL